MIDSSDIIFVLLSLVKTACLVGALLFMVSYTVMAERRVSAMIQDRLGPNRVGIPLTNIKLWGLGQPIADALKLLLKEQPTPKHVRKFYYFLAPTLAMMPALITVAVVPFGSFIDLRPMVEWVGQIFSLNIAPEVLNAFRIPAIVANLDVGILFVFAIVSVSVYGIVLAGWSSNSKYPFLGGIRSSAQMISYELSMGLAVVPVILITRSLSLVKIVDYQAVHGWLIFPWAWSSFVAKNLLLAIPLIISFILFVIAAFAETNRLPFDIPESEQELVGGYHTEYGAMKFGLFFLGEYAAMIAVSSVVVSVFLGGWSLPFPWFNGMAIPPSSLFAGEPMPWWFGFVHIGVFLAKVIAFLLFFIWVRWTLPRFRYDQLMNLGWKVFIPLGLANIFLTAFLVLFLFQR